MDYGINRSLRFEPTRISLEWRRIQCLATGRKSLNRFPFKSSSLRISHLTLQIFDRFALLLAFIRVLSLMIE